jgi:hypothetical protein
MFSIPYLFPNKRSDDVYEIGQISVIQKMAYSLSNKATDLLKELKRSEWIPKYNVTIHWKSDVQEDGINTVFDEMDRLMERILIMYDKMQTYTSELSEGNDAE